MNSGTFLEGVVLPVLIALGLLAALMLFTTCAMSVIRG